MNKRKTAWILLALLLTLGMLLTACSDLSRNAGAAAVGASGRNDRQSSHQEESRKSEKPSGKSSDAQAAMPESGGDPVSPEPASRAGTPSFPDYSGSPYSEINNNIPDFSDSDLTTASYESYGELDSLGRCTSCIASVGPDLMPAEERGSIGMIRPTGWHTVKYDWIDGKYLYNRCHLIGYQLTGETTNEKNLITGTRSLNINGMLPFENLTADYIRQTGHHVLYRVTPVFDGNNLLASGVHMEAESVEDHGAGVMFNVYCYNIEGGVSIDYTNGESRAADSVSSPAGSPDPFPAGTESGSAAEGGSDTATSGPAPAETAVPGSAGAMASPGAAAEESASALPDGTTYIINKNTGKFHYPDCPSVDLMKESNKEYSADNRDDLISRGYAPCQNCNP